MSDHNKMISCCGADCSTCYCYGEICKGCNAVCGKVFHAHVYGRIYEKRG